MVFLYHKNASVSGRFFYLWFFLFNFKLNTF